MTRRLGALLPCTALCLVTLLACDEPAPPPRPARVPVLSCATRSFESGDGRSIVVHARVNNPSGGAFAAAGELTAGIQHRVGRIDEVVCSGTTAVTAADYSEGQQEGAIATITLDSECPPPAEGAAVVAYVSFQFEGAPRAATCQTELAAPAVFGGGGLRPHEQTRVGAVASIESTPRYADARAYADRIGSAVAALSPAEAAVDHSCSDLTEEARRPLLMGTDVDLAAIGAASSVGFAPWREGPYGFEHPLLSPALLALGRLTHAGEGDAAVVMGWLEAHSPLVGVVQTRSLTLPAEHGGSQDAVHTYTPGTFAGVLSILDPRDGRVLCSQGFSATHTSDYRQVAGEGPRPSTLMHSDFRIANLNRTWETARALIPDLTLPLPEPPP